MSKAESHIDWLAPTESKIKLEQDKRDLADVQMGETITRPEGRFLPDSASPQAIAAQREKEDRRTYIFSRFALEMEQARLALYNQTVELANRASMLAASGIEKYQQLLNRQETQYNLALEQNARQLNGEYIFRGENDAALYADGIAVDPAIAAGIEWNDTDMTYAEHMQWQDTMLQTRETIDEYHLYEVRVGEIQNDLKERKDDISNDEMQAYQQELIKSAPAGLSKNITEHLKSEVQGMNIHNFVVRPRRESVEKYQNNEAWQNLGMDEYAELKETLSNLPSAFKDVDTQAKQFDLLIFKSQLALLNSEKSFLGYKKKIVETASALEELQNVPMVAEQMALILEIQTDEFWKDITLIILDKVRKL